MKTREQKIQAVREILALKAQGMSWSAAYKQIKVPVSTATKWVKRFKDEAMSAEVNNEPNIIVHDVTKPKDQKSVNKINRNYTHERPTSQNCYMIMGTPDQLLQMLLKVNS